MIWRRLVTVVFVAITAGGFPFAPCALGGEDRGDTSPAAPALGTGSNWILRLPQAERVIYRGVVSFDDAGTGTMALMYPAPSAGGMLAAVLTHGLLVGAAKDDQKAKLQTAANNVLGPYKAVLDNFDFRDLMRRALRKTANGANGKLIDPPDDAGSEMLVESLPVFSLTQDQKAIILDNVVSITVRRNTPAAIHPIRVVSTAQSETDIVAFWMRNDGEKLKDESARLVALSFDTAFRNVVSEADNVTPPYRTIRYQEGAAEKIERAQVLSNDCSRLVIRTLRGTLMSVPASSETTTTSVGGACKATAVLGSQ